MNPDFFLVLHAHAVIVCHRRKERKKAERAKRWEEGKPPTRREGSREGKATNHAREAPSLEPKVKQGLPRCLTRDKKETECEPAQDQDKGKRNTEPPRTPAPKKGGASQQKEWARTKTDKVDTGNAAPRDGRCAECETKGRSAMPDESSTIRTIPRLSGKTARRPARRQRCPRGAWV